MQRIFAAAFLMLVASGVFAQGTPNTIELTPTVGYWFGDTISQGTVNNINFDMTIDDASSYGLRVAYRFTPMWAVEGYLAKERANLVTGRGEFFGGQNKLGRMDMTTAEVNAEVSFGHSRFVPFLGGGVGAMRLDPSITAAGGNTSLTPDTKFVGDFGAGFKLFFSPQVALRFDWRGHSVNISSQRGCDWWSDCHSDRNWLTFSELSLGLTFVF